MNDQVILFYSLNCYSAGIWLSLHEVYSSKSLEGFFFKFIFCFPGRGKSHRRNVSSPHGEDDCGATQISVRHPLQLQPHSRPAGAGFIDEHSFHRLFCEL